MTEAPELLPCPFCGGQNARIDIGLMEFQDGEVSCPDCGGNCGNHPTKDEAIAAWSRRTPAALAAAPEVIALIDAAVAKEREACAGMAVRARVTMKAQGGAFNARDTLDDLAAAIRARTP